eukprot:1160722-Pelagomonas_calceolata.AAC.13
MAPLLYLKPCVDRNKKNCTTLHAYHAFRHSDISEDGVIDPLRAEKGKPGEAGKAKVAEGQPKEHSYLSIDPSFILASLNVDVPFLWQGRVA